MSEFCIHYPSGGMAMNDICKKGVDMRPFKPASVDAPCYNEKVGGCPLAEYPTLEQRIARDIWISRELEAMMAVMENKSDTCPHCNKKIDALQQVGRCVYARPCGCRLWQGKVPKEWKSGASSI